jgi:predicted nucleotide-binding protein (sugar kinase/HSP70/actin superfamily)
MGAPLLTALVGHAAIGFLESVRGPVRSALRRSGLFAIPPRIEQLAAMARKVLSLGNASGEGWFLTAEMLELIESDVPNIICAQPFACLPNHVTGKGMIREIRRLYPQANIVPVDYDPGASEVNQLNRIKLMIASCVHGQEPPVSPSVRDAL